MSQPAQPSPIRVMNIISRLNIGGISPFLIPLTAGLNVRGHQATLMAGSLGANEGDMSYLAKKAGVEVISVPSLGRDINPIRDVATIRELVTLLRRHKPHIVHTHTAKAGFVGRLAAKLAGIPLIFHTYHGHVFAHYFSPAKTRFYVALEQFCAALSTRIITVSPNLQREITQLHHITSLARCDVVVPGYDLSALYGLRRPHGDFRAKFGIDSTAPLIGIIGRLVPIKNHALFLQAAHIVRQSLPNAVFAIIGDGELRPEAEALVDSLDLRANVCFTSWQNDLLSIYAALDCVVLSSKAEGLPSAVIEGLVTGVPIAATAVGGMVDMLPPESLAPSQDAQALANIMMRNIQDPTVRATAEAGRETAFNQYHIDPATDRLDAFYRHHYRCLPPRQQS
jgi:glycosyltransferase involved in cell wall biosynthesis